MRGSAISSRIRIVCELGNVGNIFDVDMRKMTLFPLCHILTGTADIQERTVTYSIDVLVMNVVDYSKQDPNVEPYSFEGVAQKQDIYHRSLFTL